MQKTSPGKLLEGNGDLWSGWPQIAIPKDSCQISENTQKHCKNGGPTASHPPEIRSPYTPYSIYLSGTTMLITRSHRGTHSIWRNDRKKVYGDMQVPSAAIVSPRDRCSETTNQNGNKQLYSILALLLVKKTEEQKSTMRKQSTSKYTCVHMHICVCVFYIYI